MKKLSLFLNPPGSLGQLHCPNPTCSIPQHPQTACSIPQHPQIARKTENSSLTLTLTKMLFPKREKHQHVKIQHDLDSMMMILNHLISLIILMMNYYCKAIHRLLSLRPPQNPTTSQIGPIHRRWISIWNLFSYLTTLYFSGKKKGNYVCTN